MSMDLDLPSPAPKFSSGFDLASLAVASDLIYRSWVAKSKLQGTLNLNSSSDLIGFNQYEFGKFNVAAFVASVPQSFIQNKGNLVSSVNDKLADFRFLCSKPNPEFFINDAAISLFHAVRDRLSSLKETISESSKSTPWIVTGQGLGGSLASLFTLWLLDSLNPVTTKRPLCITFGSPLVGDATFQEAISQYSTWNSCFLHVVHKDDLFPCIFDLKKHSPLGTYLFCSESGSACFASPDSISGLMTRMKQESAYQGQQDFDYTDVINCLRSKVLCIDATKPKGRPDDSFRIGILTQLAAIGFQQPAAGTGNWRNKIVESERNVFLDQIDPTKKLNEVKVQMAKLEWYKKQSAADGLGYYDSFKAMRATRDQDVMLFKKKLDIYWQTIVEEVEKKPQRADAQLRKRWLFGGTNYRRMVEPLHIAGYYSVKGRRNYITEGRPKHYKKLEELLKESEKPKADPALRSRSMMASNMTEDSCFWAHVEEAILSCESLKRDVDADRNIPSLKEFEKYVFGLIKNYGVSPEIFLKDCTYMKWWKMYEQGILRSKLMGIEHDSQLIRFMRDYRYRDYETGRYNHLDDEMDCD